MTGPMVDLEDLATHPQRVLVTVTGPDHPGITAAMAGVLAEREAKLLDIEQVVLQGQLTLCLLVGFEPGVSKGESALKDLLFTAKRMGLDLSFRVLENREGVTQIPPAASARFAGWARTLC